MEIERATQTKLALKSYHALHLQLQNYFPDRGDSFM